MRAHWRWWVAGGIAVAVLLAAGIVVLPKLLANYPDRPSQLEVNLVSQPLTVQPGQGIWFSWDTNDTRAGQSQKDYQVRVAAKAADLDHDGQSLWDSGLVPGGSPGAAYHGPALADGTRYWWSVRTADAQGHLSRWSAPAQFGTALAAAWDPKARPVWAHAPASGTDSGWAFLRGTVTIDPRPIQAATVYATGGSTEPARQYVFRLSLNGTVLGVGPARAGNPAATAEYSAWDVTRALRAGTDTFGALAYSHAHSAFQLELVVQYKDGTRQVWGTGKDWVGLDGGPVYPDAGSISQNYYAAPVENLNAERYPFGFDTPGYRAPAGTPWATVVGRAPLTGLTPDPAGNVTLAAHKPAKVTSLGPGRYLLDFGTTQVGGLRLTLNGTAGQKVRILSGEVLSGPDTVRYHLSAGDTYDDTWTLRGGRQTLQYWGYRVFRYVEVDGAPQPLTAANTAALAMVYASQPDRSSVSTASPPLDQVWQFSKDTIESLNLNLYLDSPTRERSGAYEGDDYVHQRAQAMTDGDSALAQFSLQYALAAMALPNETPIFEFQQLAPVAALDQWWQTGDPYLLTSLYPRLKAMLPTKYLGPDGLVSLPVNPFGAAKPVPGVPQALVDWPAGERDGFVFSAKNTVENAFAYAAYSSMAQIAAQVGDRAGAGADAAAAARIQQAARGQLYDPATGAFRDGAGVNHEAVQSSVYAVALGLASPAQAKTAAASIARRGMACSVYCAGYLLQALYDGGQGQAALSLLTADTATSWRNMIAQGAGSTMEAWGPADKPNLTYSHPWAASPAYIVPQYLFGVCALSPGWGTVLIHPQPGNLPRGSARVPTPRGTVSVAFTSGKGGFTATVTVPATATAQVALPGVRPGQQVYVDGSAVTAAAAPSDGPAGGPANGAAGLAVVPVGSGSHQVSTSP